jgi:hypothetical protein
MSKIWNRGSRIAAIALAGAFIGFAAAPLAQAQSTSLTTEEQSQESALVQKALDAIRALPATSSQGSYLGVLFDAAEGYSSAVVAAAMNQVAGTPGLPAAAQAAAHRVARAYEDSSSGSGHAFNSFGFNGTLPGLGAPGFASGGGGGTAYKR